MKKRDIISEILSKNSRLYPETPRWEQVSVRLGELRTALRFLRKIFPELQEVDDRLDLEYGSVPRELERYFPMALVACVEGYFRLSYANLIDFGPPFRDNASKFTEVKFSVEMALSLEYRGLSIGEFVAHLLPHNNLDDIDKNLSTLMGCSFLERVKEMHAKGPMQATLFPEYEPDRLSFLFSNMKALFELRHIYAHELSPLVPEAMPSVDACVESAVEFLWYSEKIIDELTSFPDAGPDPFDEAEVEFYRRAADDE